MKSSFETQVIFLTVILSICGWMVLQEGGFPFFCGGIWGAANLLLIKQLIPPIFSKNKKNYSKIALLLILKCPLLYLMGYFLLKTHRISITPLLLGFSLLFLSMILVLGKTIAVRRKEI
jgi:hypothetical protein